MHHSLRTPRPWLLVALTLTLLFTLALLRLEVLAVSPQTEPGQPQPIASAAITGAYTLTLPFVAHQTPPVVTISRVVAGSATPLNGAIVPGQSVTVAVALLESLTGVQVTLTPGGGAAQDVTAQFAGLESSKQSQTVLTSQPGDYSLTVSGKRSGGSVQEVAGLILLGSQDNLVSQQSFALQTDGEIPAPHESGVLLLLFPETATGEEMAALLAAYGLRPLDVNLSLKLVRAQLPVGISPAAMTARLQGDPRVAAAGPNFALQEEPAAGERYPARLSATYKASSDATCSGGSGTNEGCFDHSGDPTDELTIFRYHYFLDTFAAHRLVESLVPAPTLPTTIGIVDTGVTIAGANPLDVPPGQFVNITPLPSAFDNSGAPTSGPFGLATVADTNSSGHGTSVVAVAAGRGMTTLGTGMHLRVRPLRRSLWTFAELVGAFTGLARDKNVVAINGSFGTGSMDMGEPYTDVDGDGRYTPGEPYTDLSGNGVYTGPDGIVSPWERTWVRNNIVPLARPVFSRGFNQLMNPFVDQNNNFTYDAGEPFADTNGNGVYDGAGDGKIYIASGGNDGTSYGVEIYPKVLGPPHTRARTAADFLLMVVSNSQTQDNVRGPEQLRASSNYGPQTSVAAPGGQVILPDHTGTLAPRSGTSFSAPQVTGLAGEIIYLDQHTNPPASRLSPLQTIEIIEATADDLGTTVGGDSVTRANNTPSDGPDLYFGHGRINAWKAMLAVINRGIAAESHASGASFPALATINEANTKWYGFKVHAPIRGSTLWIDGVQVTDGGSSAPGGVNAYAGVRTDRTIRIGVTGEDPTSGVVPMGSASDFLITVSVERAELSKAGGTKSLQLRRPGQTAADAPFFVLELKLQDMRDNKVPGVVFDDFVFEITPPDFGDASASPTSLADDGARHLHFQMEYLGKANAFYSLEAVSPEHKVFGVADPDGIANWGSDLEDLDGYDDGVTLYPLSYKPGGRGRADVQVCVAETGARYDAANRDKQLFVNGWIDWNTSGSWQEGAEHVLDGLRLAPITDTTAGWTILGVDSGAVTLLSSNSDCGLYKVEFPVPDKMGASHLQARFRLDYGENVGRHANSTFSSSATLSRTAGAAWYGEVEDYIIGPDFGDAGPDKPWPTKLSSEGPRHLSFYREWLGGYGAGNPSASREPDACVTLDSDMDGTDNLGNLCDKVNLDGMDDFTVSIPKPGKVRVEFEVSSGIQGYGFDGNNAGVRTLATDCTLVALGSTPETPTHQQVKMRYDAGNSAERLYVNIFADWNGDGGFETHLLSGPVDPESFGKDGAYTLGEPFSDSNGDGVWNSGETFIDVAGETSKPFDCEFDAPTPPPVGVTQWVRIRLDWGENASGALRGQPFEEDPLHAGNDDRGGLVWGEVEDAPLTGGPPHRTWTVPVTPGVPVTTGAIPTEGLDGTGPYTFRLVEKTVTIDNMTNTPLPPGLHLDTATGSISGVTRQGGDYHPLVETVAGASTPSESVVALEWFTIRVPVQITTHLLNQLTGRPIPNKEMRLFTGTECTGAPIATATTDARGQVHFPNLEPVTYTVQLPVQPGLTGVGNTCQWVHMGEFRAITRTVFFSDTLPNQPGTVQIPLFGAVWGMRGVTSTFGLVQGGATVVFGPAQDKDNDDLQDFDVEITEMHLQGQTNPQGTIRIRENPTQTSTGLAELRDPTGGFQIDSFFDVWTEVSLDGGQTWIPSEQSVRHQDANPAHAFPPVGATLTGQNTTYGPPSAPTFVEIYKSILVLDPTVQTLLFLGLEQGE